MFLSHPEDMSFDMCLPYIPNVNIIPLTINHDKRTVQPLEELHTAILV